VRVSVFVYTFRPSLPLRHSLKFVTDVKASLHTNVPLVVYTHNR
jgi:hypothetical protein